MSEQYIETILVECDRSSASVKSKDDNSSWINEQNNTLLLLPNDKVSVYSSYVNDIGSGQDAPIEFRGKKLKKKKTIEVIQQTDEVEIVGDILQSINYITYTTDELKTIEIDNTDNEANLVINFYKTMDLKNYIQLPRRFIELTENLSQSLVRNQRLWNFADSVALGRTHVETPYIYAARELPENNGYGYVPQDMRAFPSYFKTDPVVEYGDALYWIQKNDNTRYTIMKKLNNVNPNQPNLQWQVNKISATRKDSYSHHAPYYAREPEYFQYKMVREHINLKADVGFNSASSIAKKLSQDLQATKVNERDDFQHKMVGTDSVTGKGLFLDFVLNKTLESKTYKQIDVGSEELQRLLYYKTALLNGIDASGAPSRSLAAMTAPLDGVQLEQYVDPTIGQTWRVTDANEVLSAYYYNAYRFIACKRPEIYEAGSDLNDIFGLDILENMLIADKYRQGMPLRMPYFETDNGLFGGNILEPRRPSAKLLKFKTFIESQELYPDLWSQECVEKLLDPLKTNYYSIDARPGGGGSVFNQKININNSRFAHMNTFVLVEAGQDYDVANSDVFEQDRNRHENPLDAFSPVKDEYIKLGNSYYDYRGSHRSADTGIYFNRSLTDKSQSRPFFYHYDPDQKDEFHVEPVTLNDISSERWSYGCFGLSGDYGFGPTNGVVVYPSALTYNKTTHQNDSNVGLPDDYYHTFASGVQKINKGTKAGFDRHWNAWANACICLNSGKGRYGYPNTAFIEGTTVFERAQIHPGTAGSGLANPTDTIPRFPDQGAVSAEGQPSNQLLTTTYNNKMYIGADSPKLDFDGSYFNFKDLHTGLNKGNLKMVDPIVQVKNGISFDEADGGTVVYKINPTQEYEQYSPVQYPYNRASEYFVAGTAEPRQLTRMNFNLEALTIYDTTTGIFIADFGYDKDSWNEGLWARLGFSYEQFHSSTLSRLERVNLNNINDLNIVTTNAAIDCVDTKSWDQDQFGVATFSGLPLVNKTIQVSTHAHAPPAATDARTIRWIPPIYQATESIKIQAQNYPISMFNGYYSIRSDIVGDSSFVDGRGNTAMPIVSVISKQNPAGDFYITPESDIQFTITKPTRVSSVSVSITEPDGSPAPISERSSVIFKLQRTRVLNMQLAQEVFEQFAEQSKENKKKSIPNYD